MTKTWNKVKFFQKANQPLFEPHSWFYYIPLGHGLNWYFYRESDGDRAKNRQDHHLYKWIHSPLTQVICCRSVNSSDFYNIVLSWRLFIWPSKIPTKPIRWCHRNLITWTHLWLLHNNRWFEVGREIGDSAINKTKVVWQRCSFMMNSVGIS